MELASYFSVLRCSSLKSSSRSALLNFVMRLSAFFLSCSGLQEEDTECLLTLEKSESLPEEPELWVFLTFFFSLIGSFLGEDFSGGVLLPCSAS